MEQAHEASDKGWGLSRPRTKGAERMSMTTTTATELKNRLGVYLDTALTEPVLIQKSGRDVAVLISKKRYAHLEALEDEIWLLRAMLAEKDGYIGVEKSQRVLEAMLDEGYCAETGINQ